MSRTKILPFNRTYCIRQCAAVLMETEKVKKTSPSSPKPCKGFISATSIWFERITHYSAKDVFNYFKVVFPSTSWATVFKHLNHHFAIVTLGQVDYRRVTRPVMLAKSFPFHHLVKFF